MLELAILGLLHDQELHGYEIRRRLRDELGLFANVSFGSLYPALSRLERSRAVIVTEGPAGAKPAIPFTGSLGGERAGLRARRAAPVHASKRSRKVYRITDEGSAQFERLLVADEPAGADEARGFGLRLVFARHLSPDARLDLLERRRAELQRRLAGDQTRAADHRLDVYARSLVEHSTEATEHDIAWLDRMIQIERQQHPASEHRGAHQGEPVTTTKGTMS